MLAWVARDVVEAHAVDQEVARGLRDLVVRDGDVGVVVVAWADRAADDRDPRRRCVDVEGAERRHAAERHVVAALDRPAVDRHVAKLDVARARQVDSADRDGSVWHKDDATAAPSERLRRVDTREHMDDRLARAW